MSIRLPNSCTAPTFSPGGTVNSTPMPGAPPSSAAPNDGFELQQAASALLAGYRQASGSFFGGGTIDMNDLYAAANGQRGPQVQQAAQYLLSNPQALERLDTRGKANPDGKISQKDLELTLNDVGRQNQVQSLAYDPRLNDFQSSVSTLQQYLPMVDNAGSPFFSGRDGKFSRKDLNAVITNNNMPPQLRQAAFFLTMNPDLSALLDTGAKGGMPDGRISQNDLQNVQYELDNLRAQMPQGVAGR